MRIVLFGEDSTKKGINSTGAKIYNQDFRTIDSFEAQVSRIIKDAKNWDFTIDTIRLNILPDPRDLENDIAYYKNVQLPSIDLTMLNGLKKIEVNVWDIHAHDAKLPASAKTLVDTIKQTVDIAFYTTKPVTLTSDLSKAKQSQDKPKNITKIVAKPTDGVLDFIAENVGKTMLIVDDKLYVESEEEKER